MMAKAVSVKGNWQQQRRELVCCGEIIYVPSLSLLRKGNHSF